MLVWCSRVNTYTPPGTYLGEMLPATADFRSLLTPVDKQTGMEGICLPCAAGQREDISLGQVKAAGVGVTRGLAEVCSLGIECYEAGFILRLVRFDQGCV